jgi:hypothetical protein
METTTDDFKKMISAINMLIIIMFCAFSLLSCDIPGKIEVINKSHNLAHLKIIQIRQDGTYDTIDYEIVGANMETKTILMFGFGHRWSNKEIQNYTKPIVKMELITIFDTTVIDKTELFSYLKASRTGLFKQDIRIIIE